MVARSGLEGLVTSYESSGNGSTSNISNGGTFTGSWERVDVGSGLVVDLKADQNLTVQVEYSVDGGTNVDSTLTSYYKTSQIEPPITYSNARPWYRVKVTNSSGTDTTTLRLNTYVTPEIPVLNIPTDGTMSQDYQALSVRPTDFTHEVAVSRRQGWETWNKFGFNLDVDSASPEVIASFGGTFARMTSADTLDVVSSAAADDSGSTGANSIVIYGIDENRDAQIEVVTMDGTTTVTTTGQWLGVNRVAVFLFGSGERNAGTITVTATTAGSTQAEMPVGTATTSDPGGVTQQMIFHVPRNHSFLATYLRFNVNKLSGGGSPRVTLRGIVYSAVNQGYQEVYRETIDTSVANFIDIVTPEPFVVSEQTILFFVAATNTNNTVVSGRFSGKLARDADA